MRKIKREGGTWWCFAELSESHHSPLVLIGAPAQGCSSPLIHARIKCSLWVDSLTLRHGESPTTTHNLSLVIIRRACGWPNSSCERLWVIHRDGVSNNQPVESTWSLRGSRGSYTLCAGAPTSTSGEWRLSDTSVKHRRVPPSLFTSRIYFEQFNSCHLHL